MTDVSDNATGEDKPQVITPQQYLVGQEGVALIDNEIHRVRLILDIPLWCSNKDDTTAMFEWVMRTGEHRKSIMLLDTLIDSKETDKWLLSRCIVGFIPTRKGIGEVKRYMLACVQMLDKGFVADKAAIKKAVPQAVSTLAKGFIDRYSKQVTEVLLDEQYWTIPYATFPCERGRAQRESKVDYSYAANWSLAVLPGAFIDYARTLGFAYRELKRLLRLGGVKQRQLILARDENPSHVWVLPLLEGDYVQRGSGIRCRYRSRDKV